MHELSLVYMDQRTGAIIIMASRKNGMFKTEKKETSFGDNLTNCGERLSASKICATKTTTTTTIARHVFAPLIFVYTHRRDII